MINEVKDNVRERLLLSNEKKCIHVESSELNLIRFIFWISLLLMDSQVFICLIIWAMTLNI